MEKNVAAPMIQERVDEIRVLLADAHPIVRLGLRHELDQQQDIAVVGETGDGREVITLVHHLHPHVVLLDVNLHHLNGIQIARRLNRDGNLDRTGGRAEILVLTALRSHQYIWSLLAEGVTGYLLKQDPPEVIAEGIRRVAAGETVLNPDVQTILLRSIPHIRQELSPVEITILRLVGRGLTNGEIAAQLAIAESTLAGHLHNVYRKIPWLRNRAEATAWAWINQLVRE